MWKLQKHGDNSKKRDLRHTQTGVCEIAIEYQSDALFANLEMLITESFFEEPNFYGVPNV